MTATPLEVQLAALANAEERIGEVAAVLGMLGCDSETRDLVAVRERLAVVRQVRRERGAA